MVIKSMLLAIYGRHIAYELQRRKLFRTANQLEGAVLSVRNNIAEARSAESRADFIHKLKIADKELGEAEGIICTLTLREGLNAACKNTLCTLTDELTRILGAAIATAKRNA